MLSGDKYWAKCRRLCRKYGDSDNNKVYGEFPVKEVKIGNSICRSFYVKDLVEFLGKKMSEDPNYLLITEGLLSSIPVMETFDMMTVIKDLYEVKRELVSIGFQDSINYLQQHIPLRVHSWKSGSRVWSWKVPSGDVDTMWVGEYTVKGFGDETIILPIHLDHAYMANDNLSGIVVAMKLIDMLQRTVDLKYSYKFLFVPETYGTIAYLDRFGIDYKYGIVFDSIGTKGEMVTTLTKTPSVLNLYVSGKTNEFLSDEHLFSGNDERVLESVNIPSIQISRCPFKEYHTAEDTPDIIYEERLKETLDYIYSIILRIEMDFIPVPNYIGVPFLSEHGLWEKDVRLEKIWHLINGKRTISEIAVLARLPFNFVHQFVRKMEKKGLV